MNTDEYHSANFLPFTFPPPPLCGYSFLTYEYIRRLSMKTGLGLVSVSPLLSIDDVLLFSRPISTDR